MNLPFTETELRKQIKDGTATADTYYWLGMALLSSQGGKEVNKCFLQAVKLDPYHAKAWLELARDEITDPEIKDPQLALQHINRAIELEPSTEAYSLRALLYSTYLHQPQKALEDVETVLKLKPDDAYALEMKRTLSQDIQSQQDFPANEPFPFPAPGNDSSSFLSTVKIISAAVMIVAVLFVLILAFLHP